MQCDGKKWWKWQVHQYQVLTSVSSDQLSIVYCWREMWVMTCNVCAHRLLLIRICTKICASSLQNLICVYWMSSQVENILQQNCVGVAMEGVNLGRRGQLCWVQVCALLSFHFTSAVADAVFSQLRSLFPFCGVIARSLYHKLWVIKCLAADSPSTFSWTNRLSSLGSGLVSRTRQHVLLG